MKYISLAATQFLFLAIGFAPGQTLPPESDRAPVECPHFPDRLHAFIWRNWECIDAPRMAKVLGTTAENVRQMGLSMGLPDVAAPMELHLRRNYICIIRRNWHLLPYDQLLTLLGWDQSHLAETLREDDFLWTKLGGLKPKCSPLKYVEPDDATKKRCAEIKAIVEKYFGEELTKPAKPRFDFVRELSSLRDDPNPQSAIRNSQSNQPIRFLYSYCALYGDPLLEPELDPYPDGLLQRLANVGVNGVWMHVVLRQISPPTAAFPEFGRDCEVRLANLRKLVERADRYGIKIYLYMNEPRAMPAAFFEKRPDVAGVKEADHITMCTSTPPVRQWLTDSLAYVFRNVPKLGGVFTITASENLTNCWSHYQQASCPRCAKRTMAEGIAEVNTAVAAGVHQGNPNAKVIVWDWGWQDNAADDIIRALPDNVYFMSVSEWDLPITRGGISGKVAEYSISAVGPGQRALHRWSIAKNRGLKIIAKVQVNITWELSAVPYLPTMNLVAEHMKNLTGANIDGLMLSWSLGGYPSPNLELVQQFFDTDQRAADPSPRGLSIADALQRVAQSRYGSTAAPHVLQAWSAFSEAFREFPYDGNVLYCAPQQMGPANPLFAKPTGYASTMVGIPFDHLDGWRGNYPAEIFAQQMQKVADGWQKGIVQLFIAAMATETSRAQIKNLEEDVRLADAAYLHFKSVANQTRFAMARNAASASARNQKLDGVVNDEIQLARRLFTLSREDARIGYEASNHYYYLPLDLVEKVVNCHHILNHDLSSIEHRQ